MEKKPDPLKQIEDLINQLEKLNLSPLPSSTKDNESIRKDVRLCIKKIVIYFDTILQNKLRLDLTQKNFKKEDNHYWTYLSKYYQIPSVKYCNICDKVRTPSERGMLWILLSITEKSLNESINEIYNQSFDKKFYDKNSFIVTRKQSILTLCQRLNTIHLFGVKMDGVDNYIEFKESMKTQKEIESSNEDLDFISPITRQATEKNVFVSNYNLDPFLLNKQPSNINVLPTNLNSMFFSRATIDLQGIGGNDDNGDKMGMDSLFIAIENDEKENNEPILEFDNLTLNSHRERNNNINDVKSSARSLHDNDNKMMSHLSKFQTEKENFRIIKAVDLQSVYKEEFYTFTEKTISKRLYSKKKSELHGLLGSNAVDNEKTRNELILNPQKKVYFPIDKHFKATRRADRNTFTKKDVILYCGKEIRLTNSILFYLNYFYKKEPYIKFRTKNTSLKPITIQYQNYQCALCNKKFNTIMNIPTEKIYFCSYYLKFVCSNCISEDYSIIPDFILKMWSFKKYQISKAAKQLLESWYDKPVIYIKQSDPILKKSEQLRNALVLKRKIHKIFDLMKCEKMNEFVVDTLKEHKYLVLHENLFSLQDLVEIYEETFFEKLNTFYNVMKTHILSECSTCLYKGGRCIMCMSKDIIYAFDVENVIYCNDCKRMFHKKCCTVHPCIINR